MIYFKVCNTLLAEYVNMEKFPSPAKTSMFGMENLAPDFKFGPNYDSVFNMISHGEHYAPLTHGGVEVLVHT